MVAAAQAFLDSLDDYQRGQVQYGLTDDERSDWSNLPHSVYIREGVSISELSPERLDAAWTLISASLSAAGSPAPRRSRRWRNHCGTTATWMLSRESTSSPCLMSRHRRHHRGGSSTDTTWR